MSKLRFDVNTAALSKLIMNLANPATLVSNLPIGATTEVITEAIYAIANEIDRRLPVERKVTP